MSIVDRIRELALVSLKKEFSLAYCRIVLSSAVLGYVSD